MLAQQTIKAVNDFEQIFEEQSITVDVIANDTINTNQLIELSLTKTPVHGNAFVQVSGKILYSPSFNFFGKDTLQYQVCDSENVCSSAFLFVDVLPVNDSPIAIDDIVVAFEEQEITFHPATNDLDIDGDSLAVQTVGYPVYGSITLGGNNSLVYLPPNNFIGWDTLTYLTCDSLNLCDEGVVFLKVQEVNDAPTVINESFETDIGKQVSINLIENDFDEEDNNLTLVITGGPANGTVSGNVESDFIYMPAVNFYGTDTVKYLVCDDGYPLACDSGLATILVNSNKRPVANNDTVFVIDTGTAYISILNNDSDPDNDQLFYVLNTINNNISNKATVFDKGNGIISYQANRAFSGIDSFSYTLFDNGGLPQLTDEATIYVMATKTNKPPVAVEDVVKMDQAASVSFNILENDSDPENDPLTFEILEYPTGGNIMVDETGGINYSANYYFYGQDNLTYQLCDSTANCVQGNATINVAKYSFDDFIAYIPNAITPNGDGKNDFFNIRNIESYPENELIILNRWGQMVFEAKNYSNNWNGTKNYTDAPLPEATYYYVFSVKSPFNTKELKRGYIQIVR